MNILVTGGAGFLGSNLCKALIDNGDEVFCLDNLYTGNLNNVKELISNSHFHFIYGDIIEDNILRRINYPIHQIYNLACPASPPHYQARPLNTLKTCTLGLFNLIEFAKIYNARLLQASTSEVYGDPLEHPQTESYWGNVNPNGIRSCYDEGKRCAESIIVNSDIDYIIIRIFNTYGINMDKNDGRVVSNFITQALNGDNLTIYGSGLQTRSFCYVSDLINGLIKAMNISDNTVLNLGNPNEITLKELANKVLNHINSKSKIKYLELPKDDPARRKPNIQKANELLNWKPIINIDEGLELTIDYFRGIL